MTRALSIATTMASCWLCGCSFIFVEAPPKQIPQRSSAAEPVPFDCTTSNGAPVVDAVLLGFQVVRTGVAIAVDDSTYDNLPISREADIGLGVAFSALFLASTVYGVNTTSNCRDAIDEFTAQ